jgi:DNA-binding transcriptional ArsR family regulator
VVNRDAGPILQALADPSRRRIFERLVRSPLPVTAIAEPLSMSLPAVMKHLAVLEAAGLIGSQKIGRVRTCAIRPDGLETLEAWVAEQRSAWQRRLDALGDHLEKEETANE